MKRKRQTRRYCEGTQSIIKHVCNAIDEEKKSKGLRISISRSGKRKESYLGISERVLQDLVKKECPPCGHVEKRQREMHPEDYEFTIVKETLISLIAKNTKNVDLTYLHATLLDEQENWKWSRATIYRMLKTMNIEFRQRKGQYYERLHEDEGNVQLRNNYIHWLRKYERENRPIYFMDMS